MFSFNLHLSVQSIEPFPMELPRALQVPTFFPTMPGIFGAALNTSLPLGKLFFRPNHLFTLILLNLLIFSTIPIKILTWKSFHREVNQPCGHIIGFTNCHSSSSLPFFHIFFFVVFVCFCSHLQ